MRFVFRRSGSLVGLYIGLIFAYGSIAYFNAHLEMETVKRVLTGIVAASGLLHFYYDGFIWKVRERSTRENLGLTGGSVSDSARDFIPGWTLHGLKWVGAFVIPLGALWIGQARNSMPEVEQHARITSDLPDSARAHWRYGFALHKAGRLDEAAKQCEISLRLNPNERVHYTLGQIRAAQSRLDDARDELEEALRAEPRDGKIRSEYARVLALLGRKDDADAQFQLATQAAPASGILHYDYGVFLAAEGKIDAAINEFQTALKRQPNHPEAHYELGHAFYLKGDFEGAKRHYEETARLDPKAPVHSGLGAVYFKLGQTSQAVAQFKEALRLNPDDQEAAENLRFAEATQARSSSPTR
jgi:tetratricopeptide (TPR) repeat protein